MNATRRIRGLAGATTAEAAAKAVEILGEFNSQSQDDRAAGPLLQKLLGTWNGAVIRKPFHVDFGANLHFEEACFVDAGCVIHDQAEVRVGSFTQIAAGVQILTSDPKAPNDRPRPVRIGRNVWIGANSVIHPGVSLGDDAIVSAGSVVTADVPEGATVAGSPARILR